MQPALLNVGLNVGDVLTLSPLEVLSALWRAALQEGVEVLEARVHDSSSEPTLVARLSHPLSTQTLNDLSVTLRQDAVAQWAAGRGTLAGPKADLWGPFDPDFFVTLDGRRLSDALAIAA